FERRPRRRHRSLGRAGGGGPLHAGLPLTAPGRLTRALSMLAAGAAASLFGACAFFYPIREKRDSDAGAEGAGDANGSGCMSDQQCSQQNAGQPFICRSTDHTCQPLLSAECRVVYPRTWLDPHAVLLGAYTFLPEADPENSDLVWNYELAVQEFDDRGGLP